MMVPCSACLPLRSSHYIQTLPRPSRCSPSLFHRSTAAAGVFVVRGSSPQLGTPSPRSCCHSHAPQALYADSAQPKPHSTHCEHTPKAARQRCCPHVSAGSKRGCLCCDHVETFKGTANTHTQHPITSLCFFPTSPAGAAPAMSQRPHPQYRLRLLVHQAASASPGSSSPISTSSLQLQSGTPGSSPVKAMSTVTQQPTRQDDKQAAGGNGGGGGGGSNPQWWLLVRQQLWNKNFSS